MHFGRGLRGVTHIRFERGKNSLSSGKESFLSVPLYRREIGLDICPITFASYVMLNFSDYLSI